jgi:hypothetical protein
VVIGARFDVDAAGEACRLAFYGRLAGSLGDAAPQQLRKLQVYKVRQNPIQVDSCMHLRFYSSFVGALLSLLALLPRLPILAVQG